MQVFANGIFLGSAYVLVALGFSLMFQITRAFDLSYAATLTIAAYVAGQAIERSGLNYGASVCAAVIVAGLFGVLFEAVVFRPLRKSGAKPLVVLLASFGLMVAVLSSISALFGDQPRFVQQGVFNERVEFASVQASVVQLVLVLTASAISILCWLAFYRTQWGLTVRALANDHLLSRCFGISAVSLTVQCAALGAGIGALAAALTCIDVGYTPSLGFDLLLPGVIACIVGGSGKLGGAIVGGLGIGLIHEYAGWFLSVEWEEPVLFGILALFLLLRPQGVIGYPIAKAAM